MDNTLPFWCLSNTFLHDKFVHRAASAREYIIFVREATQNWHSGIVNKNNNKVQKGNYYASLALDKRREFNTVFETCLKENNYRYNRNDDNTITYWYER